MEWVRHVWVHVPGRIRVVDDDVDDVSHVLFRWTAHVAAQNAMRLAWRDHGDGSGWQRLLGCSGRRSFLGCCLAFLLDRPTAYRNRGRKAARYAVVIATTTP